MHPSIHLQVFTTRQRCRPRRIGHILPFDFLGAFEWEAALHQSGKAHHFVIKVTLSPAPPIEPPDPQDPQGPQGLVGDLDAQFNTPVVQYADLWVVVRDCRWLPLLPCCRLQSYVLLVRFSA